MSSDQPIEGAQPVADAHSICAGWDVGKAIACGGSYSNTQLMDKK